MPKITLTDQQIDKIVEMLNKGMQVEVKIEHGEPVIISIKRKKVI